jgi:hypothetical protein
VFTTPTTNDNDDNANHHETSFAELMPTLSEVFYQSISGASPAYDPNTAISFVVDASCHESSDDFTTFLHVYEDLWDDYWEDATDNDDDDDDDVNPTAHEVMWAPFHPQWRFGGGVAPDDPIHLEKQSPYPTITIVSQAVIDQAGPEATQRIGESNQATLQKVHATTNSTWQDMYDQAVRGGKE